MKKLLFISALILFVTGITAQTNKVYSFKGVTFGATRDSIVNGTADTMQIQSQYFAQTVSIQVVVSKATGTINAVTTLYASLDGVNWVIPANGDTLGSTDQATNTTAWTFYKNPYSYFRIITLWHGGSQKAYIKAYLLPNKASGQMNKVTSLLSAYSIATDTVTNTGTNYVSLLVQNWYEVMTFQANITKISGTIAGTITLQGSNDGTNYVTIPTTYIASSAHTPYVVGGAATASPTNVTSQSFLFTLVASPFQYYRLSYTGSGTMAAKLSAKVLTSK